MWPNDLPSKPALNNRILILLRHTRNLHRKFASTKPQSSICNILGHIPCMQSLRDRFLCKWFIERNVFRRSGPREGEGKKIKTKRGCSVRWKLASGWPGGISVAQTAPEVVPPWSKGPDICEPSILGRVAPI